MLHPSSREIANTAEKIASRHGHGEITTEHLLLALTGDPDVSAVMRRCSDKFDLLVDELTSYLADEHPRHEQSMLLPSPVFNRVIDRAKAGLAGHSDAGVMPIHLLISLFHERNEHSVYLLQSHEFNQIDITHHAQALSPQGEPLRLHPNMAQHYRSQVAALREALTDETRRDRAAALIRMLVERIELTPVERNGKKTLGVDLHGALAGILALAANAKKPLDESGFPVESVKLVAGARNHRYRHSLKVLI